MKINHLRNIKVINVSLSHDQAIRDKLQSACLKNNFLASYYKQTRLTLASVLGL